MRAKDLQEKAVHLKNYWRHQLGIKNFLESPFHDGYCLTTTITAGHIPDIGLSAILRQGQQQNSLYAVVDAYLPTALILNHPTSCFIQQATATLGPVALLVNPEPAQLMIRQSRLISLNTPVNSKALIDTIQILAPLLHHACLQIQQQQLDTNDARQMASLMSKHWYKVICNEA